MRFSRDLVLKYIGWLTVAFVVALAPELLGGRIDAFLTERFGEQYWRYLLGIFVLFLLLEILFKARKGKAQGQKKGKKGLFTELLFKLVRAEMAIRYQKRLDSKLASRFPVELEVEYSTKDPSEKIDGLDGEARKRKTVDGDVHALFREHGGRLLMVGAPGAGKTTLLLRLAAKLLKDPDEKGTLPLILNLATWQARFDSLEDWLTELLPQLGYNKGLSQALLDEKRLILLLDGLDELDEALRPGLLKALGVYGQDARVRYVLCSRLAEYTATDDAFVRAQLKVKPLTQAQIKRGLEAARQPAANALLAALQQDPTLRQTLTTPFYLHAAQLLFAQGATRQSFAFQPGEVEGHQQELVRTFVQQQTEALAPKGFDQAKKHLAFLADRLRQRSQVSFELTDLQYDWSRWTRSQQAFRFVFIRLVAGLIFGLASGLVLGLYYGLYRGLYRGLIIGLVNGLFHVLFNYAQESSNSLQRPDRRFYGARRWLDFLPLEHFHLRRVLRQQGLIPRHLVRFLQAATEAHILEWDGGSWRFRHKILQDYFADHWAQHHAQHDPLNDPKLYPRAKT